MTSPVVQNSATLNAPGGDIAAALPAKPLAKLARRWQQLRHWLLPLLVVLIFCGAAWLIYDQLHRYRWSDIKSAITALPNYRLLLAVLVTALSYAFVVCYDWLALLYLQKKLPLSKVALTSYLAYVCSYNMGFAGMGGAAMRVRYYSAEKLSGWDIARLVSFCAVSFWIGLFALAGVVLIFGNFQLPPRFAGSFTSQQFGYMSGSLLLLLPALYLGMLSIRDEPIKIWHYTLDLPSIPIGLAQITTSVFDNMLAASVLWILLPDTGLGFFGVLTMFMLAAVVSLISHVPGGIGVFEAVILALLPDSVDRTAAVASLLMYRVIFYLLPLLVAAVLLFGHELHRRREALSEFSQKMGDSVSKALPSVVPRVLAIVTFLSGAILLLSGAAPIEQSRFDLLHRVLPLPLLETSHFLNSLVGLLLILVARSIQRRLDISWYVTMGLLAVGSVLSITKGLDWEEAITLAAVMLLMLPCRSYFYRKSSLTSQTFSATWLVAIGVTLAACLWLGLFMYGHVQYSDQLWRQFSLSADAPRFLRATAGVAILLALFGLVRLFTGNSRPHSHSVTAAEIAQARKIVAASPSATAHLALLGDKRLLFSESGNTFIMYARVGRTWVTMGDPIGAQNELESMIWQFINLCDLHDARPAFYQLSPETLEHYLECGLSLTKLGENARVSLAEFSLDGAARSDFRNRLRRAERDELTVEVIPQSAVATILPQLKQVSDEWLESKDIREKGFSLGYFDPLYLLENPVAVVRQHGNIVAFANIWRSADNVEISIDLMRYSNSAPKGVMEYLFLKLIEYGQQQGYQWFGLGMAPLSGIESGQSAPLWYKFADALYEHGEHLYGFQGLREWKEKFDPEWRPRYLASRNPMLLPFVLTDIARLVSLREPKSRPLPEAVDGVGPLSADSAV